MAQPGASRRPRSVPPLAGAVGRRSGLEITDDETTNIDMGRRSAPAVRSEPERTSELPSEPTGPRLAPSPRRDASTARGGDPGGPTLARAFDGSFADTLRRLAPDGSAIDAPLTRFAGLPEDALSQMTTRFALRRYAAGDVVVREGDAGDACFIIASGAVRVMKASPEMGRSEPIEVAQLGPGALFGEFALLGDRRRHATVEAVEPTEVHEISRRLMRELAEAFPQVGPALERSYRERLLSTVLAAAPFFRPLPQEHRGELLSRFQPVRCSDGDRIIEEGRPAVGLFLILLGAVDIAKQVPAIGPVRITTLGEGMHFGDLALLRGGSSRATMIASGATELAMLPPNDFYEIVAAHPVLWEQLRREANRREQLLEEMIAGTTP
jgi:CRP-like cAMP-binding protein